MFNYILKRVVFCCPIHGIFKTLYTLDLLYDSYKICRQIRKFKTMDQINCLITKYFVTRLDLHVAKLHRIKQNHHTVRSRLKALNTELYKEVHGDIFNNELMNL